MRLTPKTLVWAAETVRTPWPGSLKPVCTRDSLFGVHVCVQHLARDGGIWEDFILQHFPPVFLSPDPRVHNMQDQISRVTHSLQPQMLKVKLSVAA